VSLHTDNTSEATDVLSPGSYSGSLMATVVGGLSAAQTTTFQVLAANELIHRNGFDLSQNNCP